MKRLKSVPSFILLAAILLAVVPYPAASVSADEVEPPATITVNTAVDEATTNGKCSMREAIINANNNAATYPDCAAAFGTDTITFAANYSITLDGAQLPVVTSPIIINGKGAGKTIIQASTCNPLTLPGGCTPAAYRVFEVSNPGNLTLNGLTVRHGKCTGACATFTNAGGGIFNNNGSLTVTNSTISGNRADYGGGIYNYDTGTLTVTNSTLSGNKADFDGGGIYNYDGALTVTNSTLSGNKADFDGGGIYNDFGTLYLTNSTLSANSATSIGGGITNPTGTLHYRNTIIANSTSGGDCVISGAITTNTNNLVEDGSCSPTYSGDPSLGPLANNGGPTKTHALLPNSIAINAGTNTGCPATDQTGKKRPQGAKCDIGAFEFVFPKYKSQGANDGWILESTETSGVGGSRNYTATTFNLGDDSADRQYRAILSFNTGGLPDDAVITKVTLKVKRQGVTGGGNPVSIFNGFMVDIKKGTFGTSALALGDFKANANKTIGPFSPAISSGWYTINMTSGKNQVNKVGLTQIRLRFNLDDNNNNVANFLSLYSGDAGAADRPQLIVEYYVPYYGA